MRALDVWMAGTHIAMVTESRKKMKLSYVPGVAPLGVPLISVAMPMPSAPYTDKVVRPFFHGLLPEGPARQTIAYDFGVDAGDDVGLLAALGRDCAGALMVLPAGEGPATESESPELLDDGAVEQRVRALGVYRLVWQFVPVVLRHLPRVLAAAGFDAERAVTGWTIAAWLTAPDPATSGRTPLELLRAGHIEQVVSAAAEVANSLGTGERAALAAGAAAVGTR